MKIKKLLIFNILLIFVVSCSFFQSTQRFPLDESSAEDIIQGRTAYEVYTALQEGAVTLKASALSVAGQGQGSTPFGVTWGAEKEASSWLILKAMGPNSASMKTYMTRAASNDPAATEAFLKDFFTGYFKNANGWRTQRRPDGGKIDYGTDVKNVDGDSKKIDIEALKSDFNPEEANLEQLQAKWSQWLEMTDDKPMSFVNDKLKRKLFKNEFGLGQFAKAGYSGSGSSIGYTEYTPNFGPAEKYVMNSHGTSVGWEINFNPQNTYGEFEELVNWFRSTLKNSGKLFQAPGHQRMVFVKHPNLDEGKLSEMYRAIQALIVVDGVRGKTGIQYASYKSVLGDDTLKNLYSGRGVIRLEQARWAPNTHAVEFRAGTKDIRLARQYQTILASAVATNDFGKLGDITDYSFYTIDNSRLATQLGIPESEVAAASAKMNQAGMTSMSYAVPFWNWYGDDIPFISPAKRELLKDLTRDFISRVSSIQDGDAKAKISNLMSEWVKASRVNDDLVNYMTPSRGSDYARELVKFVPRSGAFGANQVDVNTVDLGIEYSGKMPIKLSAEFSDTEMADGKKAFLRTFADLTEDERKVILGKIAKDLADNLGGGTVELVQDAEGHGHGLELAYKVVDAQGRKWAVEWDGIGRTYNANGEIVEDSVRGGSIEIVTPKFVPDVNDMDAVYKAFDSNNVVPSRLTGGGHINVDLAAFKRNPKALARFMSIFHEHRGIISFMFQHYNRMKAAEPLQISENLSNQLKNFSGTEEELKKLLYNEKYFNTRYGRKSRYAQLEMSAYFQDVIPARFITEDYDIGSSTVPWRRQFRVDPNIRKAEFRMFDAPRNASESALQIKLVRAIMHKALNETTPLSGNVQEVDHIKYLNNTEKGARDLEQMCNDLQLDIADYRPAYGEALSDIDLAKRSDFFKTLDDKLAEHPKQPGWGEAVSARNSSKALNSEGRTWKAGAVDTQNTIDNSNRIRAASQGDARRANLGAVPDQALLRTGDCSEVLRNLFGTL